MLRNTCKGDKQKTVNYIKSLCGKAAGQIKDKTKFIGDQERLKAVIKEAVLKSNAKN